MDETFDQQNDPRNCGGCGTVCGDASGGLCCAGFCRVPNASNCGACDHACTTTQVVINEVMLNPRMDGDANEWFELYNANAWPVDLRGFVLKDFKGTDSHPIASSLPVSIAPGGYLVLGKLKDQGANGGVPVDYQYSNFALGNSGGDAIVLCGPGVTCSCTSLPCSAAVDVITYSSSTPEGSSWELGLAHRTTSENNSIPTNWCSSTTPFGTGSPQENGTPGQPNTCP
jgi:hypothetical protein